MNPNIVFYISLNPTPPYAGSIQFNEILLKIFGKYCKIIVKYFF